VSVNLGISPVTPPSNPDLPGKIIRLPNLAEPATGAVSIPFQPGPSEEDLRWYNQLSRNPNVRDMLVRAVLSLCEPADGGATAN